MSLPCQQLTKVIAALCDDVLTPTSQLVKAHVINGEWIKLQKLKVRPCDYTDSEAYFLDACVVDLLRKATIDTGVDRKAAAVETFWKCETQNAETNGRLNRYLPDLFVSEDQVDNAMFDFIRSWRKEVTDVLRKLPDDLDPNFGGGSTYGDKGKLTTLPDKMSGSPTCSFEAWPVVQPLWVGTAWERAVMHEFPNEWRPTFVKGNRFSTVPKTGLTDRGICIEPSLNVSYQLSVGKHIRSKLKTIGIDLKHGQSVHRERAQASSLLDTDATIDLSNASDTICRVLPRLILSDDWYELLDSLRSRFTEINKKWVRLEKFSSMGNGFTFELETLIFVTLARCIVAREGGNIERVSCYGDDLIIPKPHVPSFMAALAFFGFTPNMDKSFVNGPFRESCGGDFWLGKPVRAHFIQELPHEPQHWIALANGFYRLGHSDPNNRHRWMYFSRAHRLCLDSIPSNIRRLTGPASLGDLVIRDDDPSGWRTFSKNFDGLPVLGVRTYSPVGTSLSWDYWRPEVQLAAALRGVPSTGVVPRDGISGYRESFAVLHGTDWLPEARIIR